MLVSNVASEDPSLVKLSSSVVSNTHAASITPIQKAVETMESVSYATHRYHQGTDDVSLQSSITGLRQGLSQLHSLLTLIRAKSKAIDAIISAPDPPCSSSSCFSTPSLKGMKVPNSPLGAPITLNKTRRRTTEEKVSYDDQVSQVSQVSYDDQAPPVVPAQDQDQDQVEFFLCVNLYSPEEDDRRSPATAHEEQEDADDSPRVTSLAPRMLHFPLDFASPYPLLDQEEEERILACFMN